MSLKTNIRNTLIEVLARAPQGHPHGTPRRRVIALHEMPEQHHALFEEKMAWLKEHYHVVSLSDLTSHTGLSLTKTNVALTFDDGFKEYATFVAPTLAHLALPATFFVPSGVLDIVGEDAQRFSKERLRRSVVFEYMTTAELLTLSQNPLFEMGGHTAHHTDVSTLDENGIQKEIIEDKHALEAIVGKKLRWFAYTFGGVTNINTQAMQAIQACGYEGAFTIIPAFWKESDHPYLVGRDSMSVADPEFLWDAWLRGGYDFLSALKNAGGKKALLRTITRT